MTIVSNETEFRIVEKEFRPQRVSLFKWNDDSSFRDSKIYFYFFANSSFSERTYEKQYEVIPQEMKVDYLLRFNPNTIDFQIYCKDLVISANTLLRYAGISYQLLLRERKIIFVVSRGSERS